LIKDTISDLFQHHMGYFMMVSFIGGGNI